MSEQERMERETRLIRIQRVSAVMKWIMSGILVILFVFGLAVTFGIVVLDEIIVAADDTIDFETIERTYGEIPQVQRIGIASIAAIAFTLLLIASWKLRQVFTRFQQLEFFSSKTLSSIISFGSWLIVFGVFDLVSDPIGSVILTYDFLPDERVVDVTIDGGEIFFLLLGALILLFGWILREAALIDEENRQII